MKRRISWIEDDADLIYEIVAPLEKSGFVIEVYRTAHEALNNIEQIRSSSLLLLDLILPSGREEERCESEDEYEGVLLLQTLRSKYAINIPIIVLSTASAIKRFTKIVANLAVSDILVKPCLPSQLERSVMATLNAAHRQRKASS